MTNTNATNLRKNLFSYLDSTIEYNDVINVNTKIFFEPAGKYLYTKEAYFLETKDKNSGEVIGIVIVKVGYENKTLCYTFNFAKDTKLIGFFLK